MRRVPILAALSLVAAASAAACVPFPPEGASYPIRCPAKGPVSFTNDWHAPRGPGLVHEGNDVFAPMGTENVAVVSGVIDFRTGARSGNAIWLDGDDGNDYFYAHFAAWNGSERRVAAGEVIGYTGMTGDAAGTAPHTHFEIHPAGAAGDPINPYPSLVAACTNRPGVSAASSEHGDDSSAADDGLAR